MMVAPAAAGGGTSWPTPPALSVTAGLWAHYQRGVGLYKDSGTTLATTHGDLIKQWNDHSGNGRHAVVYVPGDSTWWPSLDLSTHPNLSIPTLAFPGTFASAGHVVKMVLPDMSALTAGEVFIVIKTTADPSTDAAYSGLWRMDTSGFHCHYPYTDGNIYECWGSTTRQIPGQNPTPSLSAAFNVWNCFSATNDWGANLNNTSFATSASNTVGFPGASLAFFGGTDSLSYNMNGNIGELLIYDHKLSSTDRNTVYTYLTSN